MLDALRALPRTVWLIGFISLVNDTASELVYPLVPLFLTSVLMAGPKALGLIEGIAEATAALLKLVSGVAVDRTRRSKPWIVIGYALAALGRPLIALVTSWPALLAIRFADRVGKGLRTSPRDALLAASVGPDRRGLAFGVHRAMDNAGAVLGPLLAAGLLAAGMPLRDVLLWTLVPGVLCVLLTLALPEAQAAAAPVASSAPRPTLAGWASLPPGYRRFLAVVALFTLGNSSNMFLLLRASELGVPQAQVPLLWAAVSAIAMLLSAPLSGLSDRVGRRALLLAGYGAYALFYLVLGLASPTGAWLVLWFAFYGVFLAATEGVEKALVADLATPEQRGTAFGWFNMTAGAMLLPASAAFGWLYEQIGVQAAFGFSAGCALAAAALLRWWVPGVQEA
ncbi:Multidrug resistance protein MdtH [Tepidimonas alkaliphilus]|uniref:Multidrug resistance protein MdtH n=1 Tax=Tepidimonas alkaliphilus TaxID=2588942 RepID=A0A554WB04_9BURK|nr:MFS transporter [Tepidimonas alkaliphilus]TSE20762.1 Multidrug resistance protein MdtH [Tepidimonas alkaliphilus]